MNGSDPYRASLAITLVFFYGITGLLAWAASLWPLAFAGAVVVFFLLIYGKLHRLARWLARRGRPR